MGTDNTSPDDRTIAQIASDNPSQTFTAWELCADWSWQTAGYLAKSYPKGRILWEEAEHNDTTQPNTDNVRMGRLESIPPHSLRSFYRFVKPDTLFTLVKKDSK